MRLNTYKLIHVIITNQRDAHNRKIQSYCVFILYRSQVGMSWDTPRANQNRHNFSGVVWQRPLESLSLRELISLSLTTTAFSRHCPGRLDRFSNLFRVTAFCVVVFVGLCWVYLLAFVKERVNPCGTFFVSHKLNALF